MNLYVRFSDVPENLTLRPSCILKENGKYARRAFCTGKIAYKLAAAKLRVMGYRRADGFVGAYVAKNGDIRVIADDGKVG